MDKFEFTQTPEAMRGKSDNMKWRKFIWNTINSRKMSFTTYKVIQNGINATDKLKQWGTDCSTTSVLCDSKEENKDHCFFSDCTALTFGHS